MDGWKIRFLLRRLACRCYVSFRGCNGFTDFYWFIILIFSWEDSSLEFNIDTPNSHLWKEIRSQTFPKHFIARYLYMLNFGDASNLTTHTLPETNSSPLKMDGWKMNFLLGPGPISGAFDVSFRGCTRPKSLKKCFDNPCYWLSDSFTWSAKIGLSVG